MVKKAKGAKPNRLLRAARKERNWTQQDVADRIGSPQSFNVSRWEQGTVFPSAHYIQQLCLLFGKSVSELGLLLEEPAESSKPATGESPSPVWTVPFRRNPFFTGREKVLKQLHDRFSASRTVALTQTQAISGLGGIGKTQIAVEFSYYFRAQYRFVLWVRAASRDALISDFVSLAGLLHLPEENEQDQNRVVAAMKRWLANHQGWLLILDNADDLELVAEFLPAGDDGHILLTTRAQATGSIAYGIAIEKMDNDESMLLLLRRAKLLAPDAALEQSTRRDRNGAQAIVKALDGLPLALDQAGAYIEETGCGLAEYLEMYRQHRRELLSRGSSLSPMYPYTVMSTWMLSFQHVEQANPAAADLLGLLAFLDPDAIAEEILTAGSSWLGPMLAPVAANGLLLNQAIEALRAYSLVQRNPGEKSLSVHRLVQAVLKDALEEPERREWAERAMRAVNAAFPDVEYSTWAQCERLLPQALLAAQYIEQDQLFSEEAGRLLYKTATYLKDRARYAEAEPLYQWAVRIWEQAYGPEHPLVALPLNNLAELYRDQGKYAEAESLYQRALRIREQALGAEHPDMAASLNGLANLYLKQGKYEEAEPLYQRALRIREQARPGHPDVAETLHGLASSHDAQGKSFEAAPLYQRALAIREKVLGPEHPETIATQVNYNDLLKKMQRVAELAQREGAE